MTIKLRAKAAESRSKTVFALSELSHNHVLSVERLEEEQTLTLNKQYKNIMQFASW